LSRVVLWPRSNLLTILAVLSFVWQQKRMTPPVADDRAGVRQKLLFWMTSFIGVLFFKVASGMCNYFVASSL